jgi:DNA replication and repair protein RecF
MRIRSLTLDNLRNISHAALEPGPALNVLHGANGAGKTTVLESIVILAKGRSFRSGAVGSLIGPDGDLFRTVTLIEDDAGVQHRIGLERDRSQWQGRIDGETMKGLNDSAPFLPLMLMEPTSYQLISGGPDQRRRYLDWSVFHVKHDYLSVWRRYTRALKQRNAALRAGDWRLIDSVTPQVSALGETLHAHRKDVFNDLHSLIVETLTSLSPKLGELNVQLRPGWKGDDLATALDQSRDRDREQGVTHPGPHRADIQFRVGGKAVRDRFSRGEQKVLAASLLLSQARLFADEGHVPAILLDDLASEFDQSHLDKVVTCALQLGAQVFVTGTNPDPYRPFMGEDTSVFHVKQGVVSVDSLTQPKAP